MKNELDRVKNDVETIQKAMGLPPSFGREWIQWMKRDKWFTLWWCLPGLIILASVLRPFDRTARYLGLVLEQWVGILVAASLLGIALSHFRQISGKDGRPEGMIRESRRIYGLTGQGLWFSVAFIAQLLVYFIWGKQHHIPFESFWAGLFVLLGSTCLVAALSARAWVLLGYAIPFMGYGLCLPLVADAPVLKGILFGIMFIAIAFSFAVIQVWEIRKVEHPAT